MGLKFSSHRAMNLGAQLEPVSITKLSPNWACQMGPIHCPTFLLYGTGYESQVIIMQCCRSFHEHSQKIFKILCTTFGIWGAKSLTCPDLGGLAPLPPMYNHHWWEVKKRRPICMYAMGSQNTKSMW